MAADTPTQGSGRAGAEPPCADLSAREAAYLLAVRDLARAGASPTQAALARSMGVAAPTALEMVKRLRQLGLLEPGELALTHEGTSAALVLASRRHAAHLLTHEVLGIDEQGAVSDADRLAPNISPELTRRLIAGRARRD
jgi:DtxR family transcriptional regulator, Mn-dependent transcriptional regulator